MGVGGKGEVRDRGCGGSGVADLAASWEMRWLHVTCGEMARFRVASFVVFPSLSERGICMLHFS